MQNSDVNTLNTHLELLHKKVIGLECKYNAMSKALYKVLQNPYNKQYTEIIKVADEYFKENILNYYKNATEYEKALLDEIVNDFQKS